MGRYISLLLFIGMMFGQDVLKTVSGKEYKGKYLKTEGGKVFFIPEGASSPTQVPIESINEIITDTGGKIFIQYDPETGEVVIKQYDPETGEVVKKQGDANVQIRLQNGQKANGEFIGTYMNHVHILVGGEIIWWWSCDDIVSITNFSEGLNSGRGFNYDCSINTVTADILFPPELDPMTGEMTQMLPDVFNPDIPKPTAKVEDGLKLINKTPKQMKAIMGMGTYERLGYEQADVIYIGCLVGVGFLYGLLLALGN